jgi:hypothetical protein
MSEKRKPAKADRLAAALRANLKRRKAQARAQAQPEGDGATPRPAAKSPKTGKNPA